MLTNLNSVRDINWEYIGDAVPAFLTIIIIPLSYKCALFHSASFFPQTIDGS